MPTSGIRENGGIGCYLHDEVAEEQLIQIHRSTLKTEENVKVLITVLDNKMERLVNHLIQKSDPKYIPVSVLGWIVVFLLVFNFAMVFGMAATERFMDRGAGIFAPKEESK